MHPTPQLKTYAKSSKRTIGIVLWCQRCPLVILYRLRAFLCHARYLCRMLALKLRLGIRSFLFERRMRNLERGMRRFERLMAASQFRMLTLQSVTLVAQHPEVRLDLGNQPLIGDEIIELVNNGGEHLTQETAVNLTSKEQRTTNRIGMQKEAFIASF
jgi:hypothetical protein